MIRTALALAVSLGIATSALAAEVKVLTAGAFKPVVQDLADRFAAGGDRLVIENDTAGALMRRIEGGEAFDVVVVTDQGIERLRTQGRITEPMRLAEVGIAIAVRDGAARPDISTPEAFRAALLAARSVAYIDPKAGGSSGIYLNALFDRLGIGEAIRAKAVLVPGGLVATRVASGEAELGLHQLSEILVVPGVTVVGPLPAAYQSVTSYAGGVSATTAYPDAARRLMAMLADATTTAALDRRGMRRPSGEAKGINPDRLPAAR